MTIFVATFNLIVVREYEAVVDIVPHHPCDSFAPPIIDARLFAFLESVGIPGGKLLVYWGHSSTVGSCGFSERMID